jgi:hypothetical protein
MRPLQDYKMLIFYELFNTGELFVDNSNQAFYQLLFRLRTFVRALVATTKDLPMWCVTERSFLAHISRAKGKK